MKEYDAYTPALFTYINADDQWLPLCMLKYRKNGFMMVVGGTDGVVPIPRRALCSSPRIPASSIPHSNVNDILSKYTVGGFVRSAVP